MRIEDSIKLIDEHIHRFCAVKKKWIEVTDEILDESLGVYPWEREIRQYISLGVINLDKPPGPTSHEVVAWIKKMFQVRKAGHGGTLEPAFTKHERSCFVKAGGEILRLLECYLSHWRRQQAL
uniref:tRNA pseudouridine synthase A n=1 Tax=Fervidicoccus fontis TaxID=683846 RepID=A0A7J3ZLD6_9CREN